MTFIDTNKHLITLFQEQVEATPHAIALEDPNHAYTYKQLGDKIDSFARYLRWDGVGPGSLVGIVLPHTADFIIACLATLRVGAAYLIVELAYPPQLRNAVIQDARPKLLITYQAEVQSINKGNSLIVLDEAGTSSAVYKYEGMPLPAEYDQDAMAFVSYSSGTTGQPKGIVNHDRPGILSYDQRFAISDQKPGDRIACNTFFIWEMFRPLIRGATAFAVPDDISYDPVGLVDLLASKHISETLMTPTLMASIIAEFENAGDLLPDLRILWLTGEVVTKDLAHRALKAFPNVRLLNSYSTAETWDTAIGEMRDIHNDVDQSLYCSVGAPLGVNKIYILDEAGNRVQRGLSGEIFIGGPVLALGYLNLPEFTSRTMVPDPFSSESGARMYRSGDLGRILPSGNLEIIGRIGSMIKLRGYSIVPAKVQTTITDRLAVRDCVVMSCGSGLQQQLVAYFVPDRERGHEHRPQIQVDSAGFSPNVRGVLSQYLPAYMIPAYWVQVARLPADPVSGKIDRKALPLPPAIAGKDVPSLGIAKTEDSSNININVMAEMWASVLRISPDLITIKRSFFDLGGHSLSLAALSAEIARRFGVRVPVARLVYPQTLQGHVTTTLAIKHGDSEPIQTDLLTVMRADCILDDEVRPSPIWFLPLSVADVVFLTGATGFLGVFLLYDLLKDTAATVLCLVRPDTAPGDDRVYTGGKARIRRCLQEKGLWHDSFATRIEAVVGDLSKKCFGLSPDAFNRLANRAQVVIHAGATVNLIYPYAALRAVNIGGTREVLRLASQNSATVHYISTNSVLPPSSASTPGWSEEARPSIEEVSGRSDGGYGQTKWVAEQLVVEAGRRGLPVRILRAGTISGHSVTGVDNDHDMLTALMVESIELGYAPSTREWYVEMSPVDFVSKAIVHLCNSDATQLVFHLGNPNPLLARDIFALLGQLGYTTQPLHWDEWTALWSEKRGSIKSDDRSPNQILDSGVQAVDLLTNLAILNNSATGKHHKGLKRPEITKSLLEKYTQYWFAQGRISRPPSYSHHQPHPSPLQVNMSSLAGRVAVVTGASSGIGAATAVALAKEGAHVVLAARRTEALESIASSLSSYNVKILVQQTDVTTGEQVEALMKTTTEKLGPIDILVSCAGVMYFTLLKNAQRDQWERTIDVNCKGLLHCLSNTVPNMLSRGSGHIVAISSDAGRKVFPGLGVYSGSKFFVEATLQSLRLETIGSGLRITSIQPGNVATDLLGLSTDQEAIKKYGEPSGAKVLQAEHVANAIIYALKQPEQVAVNEILIQPRDEPI